MPILTVFLYLVIGFLFATAYVIVQVKYEVFDIDYYDMNFVDSFECRISFIFIMIFWPIAVPGVGAIVILKHLGIIMNKWLTFIGKL